MRYLLSSSTLLRPLQRCPAIWYSVSALEPTASFEAFESSPHILDVQVCTLAPELQSLKNETPPLNLDTKTNTTTFGLLLKDKLINAPHGSPLAFKNPDLAHLMALEWNASVLSKKDFSHSRPIVRDSQLFGFKFLIFKLYDLSAS
jgi:hypothetical protein